MRITSVERRNSRAVRRHAATFLSVARELLESGHCLRFPAEGTSMVPTIHDGETIVVAPVDPAGVIAGDIVLYRQLDRPIVHRVAEVRTYQDGGTVLVLRGDGKADDDRPVGLQQVLGKVVAVGSRPPRALRRCLALRRLPAATHSLFRRIVSYVLLSYIQSSH